MTDQLEVGMKLHAKYIDGEFYLAVVSQISESKSRAKKPVKVSYHGYEGADAWLSIADLKSKLLPKASESKAKANAKGKAKAKAKAKATAKVDLFALTKGDACQAKADDDRWYKAQVVAVSKKRAEAPVKVNYVGYTSASDEWLGADRLRSKLLTAKAAAAVPHGPAPAMEVVPILRQLAAHAKKGIATAVVESSASSAPVTLSYSELLEHVKAASKTITSVLAGRKEGAPKHVAYMVNPSLAYVVAELSVWASGALAVPVSVHSPAPELEYFIEHSESQLVIADAKSSTIIKPVAEKLGRTFATISNQAPFAIEVAAGVPTAEGDTLCTVGSPALILYTSGTTGKPKGVLHTFRSLTAQSRSLSRAWKWTSKDYTLHVLPLHHIHAVQNILNTALFNGAGVELTPFDANFCLKRLASGDVTCFHAVPTIYVKFEKALEKMAADESAAIKKGLRNDNMRYMVSGSAALPVPTMKQWAEISGHVLLERYGMTEIGMALSNKIEGARYPGCVGWPLPQVRVKLDADGAILVKGPLVFKEYYRNEEATKNEFTEDHWFKTGDNAYFGGQSTPEDRQMMQDDAVEVEKATGRPNPKTTKEPNSALKKIYKIMGRTSVDIIKSGGYKLSALEIEGVLLSHEKIKEVAVIGKPHAEWGEQVTAVIVLEDGQALALADLRAWGKERMASYKVPMALEVVPELPRNQMGKLEKKKVIELYAK